MTIFGMITLTILLVLNGLELNEQSPHFKPKFNPDTDPDKDKRPGLRINTLQKISSEF